MARKPGAHQQPFILKQRPKAQEHRSELNAQLPTRYWRGKDEFSEAELAGLLDNVRRYIREGTCRVTPYRAISAVEGV